MRVLVAAEPLVFHVQSTNVALLNPAALDHLDTIIVTDYTEVELSSQEVLVEEEAMKSACVQEKEEQILLVDEAASCAHQTTLDAETTQRDVTCEVASIATATTSNTELAIIDTQNEQNLQTGGSGQLSSQDEDESTNISREAGGPASELQAVETTALSDDGRTPATRRGQRRPRNSADTADKNTRKTWQRRARSVKQNYTEER